MALDDFDLDRTTADSVLALVDRRFGAEASTRLSGGILSSVFDVRTSDGRSLVVKVYPEQLRSKMKKERFVYELLEGHTLAAPVPEILAADGRRSTDGPSRMGRCSTRA